MYVVAGILHQDIKPGNILIYTDGEDGSRGILIMIMPSESQIPLRILPKGKLCVIFVQNVSH
jgi:hypothetical protein